MLNNIAALMGGGVTAAATDYESIATVTVGAGGASTVTFSSIPSTYTHLQIRAISKGAGSTTNTTYQLNGDTAANYSWHLLYGQGSSALAAGGANASFIYLGTQSATANTFSAQIIDVLDYANTNKFKTTRNIVGYENNSAGEVGLFSGLWRSTSAVTSITFSLSTTFQQYTHFALYGIK